MREKFGSPEAEKHPNSPDIKLVVTQEITRIRDAWLGRLRAVPPFIKSGHIQRIQNEIASDDDLPSLWLKSLSDSSFSHNEARKALAQKIRRYNYSIVNLYTEICCLKSALDEMISTTTLSTEYAKTLLHHAFSVLDELFSECLTDTSLIYEASLEQSSRGYCYVDLHGTILYANSAFHTIVAVDDASGCALADFLPACQEHIASVLNRHPDTAATLCETTPVITRTILRRRGDSIPVTAEIGALLIDGVSIGGYSTITDISTFAEAEQLLYEASQLGIIKVDTTNVLTYANNVAITILGVSNDEWHGRTFISFFEEEEQKNILAQLVLRTQARSSEYTVRYRRRSDGRMLLLRIIGIPEMDSKHQWIGTFAIIRPVGDAVNDQRDGATSPASAIDQVLGDTLKAIKEREESNFTLDLLRRIAKGSEMGSMLARGIKERPVSTEKPALIICEKLTQFYEWDNVAIFKVTSDNFELVAQSAEGRDGYRMPEKYTQARTLGLLKDALERKGPVVVGDVRHDNRYYKTCDDTRSEMVLPIEINGEIIWILNVEDRAINAFPAAVCEKMQNIVGLLQATLEGIFARSVLESTWDVARYGIIMTTAELLIIEANGTAHDMLNKPRYQLRGCKLTNFVYSAEDAEWLMGSADIGPEIMRLVDSQDSPFKVTISSRALPEYGRRVFFLEDPTIMGVIEKKQQEREFGTNLAAPIRLLSCEIHDVGCFRNIEWPLQPSFNILLGRNGYGKTELLRIIAAMLIHNQDEPAAECFAGADSSIRLTAIRRAMAIGKDATSEIIERKRHNFTAASIGKVPVLALPDIRFIPRKTTIASSGEVYDLARDGALHFVSHGRYEDIIGTLLYQVCIEYMDAGNLDLPIIRLLQDVMCDLTGNRLFFDSIDAIGEGRFRILIRVQGSDDPIPIQLASQGTLSVLAIFGIIYRFLQSVWRSVSLQDVAFQPGIVLIDEIDAHLHPRWQQKIIPLLRATFPEVQFLCTAHSPLVAAGSHNGEVAVLCSDGNRFRVNPIRHDFIGWNPMKIYQDVFAIEDKDDTYRHYIALRPQRKELEQEQRELDRLESRTLEQERRLKDIVKTLYYIDKAERQQEVILDIEGLQMENAHLRREIEHLTHNRNTK